MKFNLDMRELLQAGIHFGHQTRYWNPKMSSYIYGERMGVHIVNLDHTKQRFEQILQTAYKVAANKGKILFVGTKPAAQHIIAEEANRAGMPYVNYRWLGGMLTNYKTIRQSIRRLKDLEQQLAGGTEGYTKKEMLTIRREKEKLERNLAGIKNMGSLPDALFVIDVGCEKIAVAEANRLKIPVMGVVDTNNSPDGIDYMVPGNDDALKSIRYFASKMADALIEGKKQVKAEPKKEEKPEAVKVKTVKRRVVKKKTDEASKAEEAKAAKPAAAKKPAAKKAEPKKEAEKKTAEKKPAAKTAAPKKADEKKAPAKKPAAKKTTAKKADKPEEKQ